MTVQRLFIAMAAVALLCAGCKKEVYGNLSQREANEMIAVLASARIEAEREQVGAAYRVMTEASDLPAAVEALSTAGYPRTSFRTVEELFPASKLVTSPAEQKARLVFALNQDLSNSVSTIDGVAGARVHVAVPDQDLRGNPIGKASASVLVRIQDGYDPLFASAQIKAIVSSAVAGLSPRDINVVVASRVPGASQRLPDAGRGLNAPVPARSPGLIAETAARVGP